MSNKNLKIIISVLWFILLCCAVIEFCVVIRNFFSEDSAYPNIRNIEDMTPSQLNYDDF